MNYKAIFAIIKKDIIGLLPLVLLALAVFAIQPVIANLNVAELGIDSEFMIAMQANFYWVAFFLSLILMMSVIQLDPASSLRHDWLTRPISRWDWLAAKLLFLLLTIVVPVVLSRFFVNLSEDLGLGLSLNFALGIESFEGAILVPLFFAVALMTPNYKKSVLLLVSIFFLFLLPGWSVTSPLLAAIGIRLGNELDGMMWLQALPIAAAGIVGSGFIYWFLYVERQHRYAKLAFWSTIVVMFFSVYPPGFVHNWDRAIAFHQAVINNEDASLEKSVQLIQAQACFDVAAMGGPDYGTQSNSVLSAASWIESAQAQAGPGTLTIATPVATKDLLYDWISPASLGRDISVDWRIDRFRTRAWYEADSLGENLNLFRSSTAENRFNPIAQLDTDYWMVPGDELEALKNDPTTRLVIEYDMALLSPTPHELPVNGQRYDLAELGSCKAELDANSNIVEIDCLKRGVRPELISAEYFDLPTSRVDNWRRTNFTADWLEFLTRSHFELTLSQPSLVDSATIMLSSYNVERIMRKQLVSPGVLGDSQSVCPLPGDAQFADLQQSSWSDRSPHEVKSILVERGVRLEVLDWRAVQSEPAPTLVLLAGLGATAHSYDVLAERLAQDYEVVALTRRGTGASSKPAYGYDVTQLSEDVLQVMNTLGIDQAVLVGHSIAGEELSYLGANFPERFSGLVYLDAAFDRTGPVNKQQRVLGRSLPQAPPIRPTEAMSYKGYGDYMQRLGRQRLLAEGEILASYDLTSGTIKHERVYLDAITANLQAPEYERIAIPALALYAVPGSAEALLEPWYDQTDPAVQKAVHGLFEIERQAKLTAAARFENEVADSHVIILEDANHWIFGSNEDDVFVAIQQFVDGLPADQALPL